MKFNQLFDDISFTPFRKELKEYSISALLNDLTAGIYVALLTLPQALAYALVAGLPLSTGLFAAIFSCIIASLFGSSRHLIVGPSNAIAILIQFGTAEILHNYYHSIPADQFDGIAFQIMVQLSLLVACLQLLAAGFKLGRLSQFVSYSVVLGYIVGAAAAIVIGQIFVFLGIPGMEGANSLWGKGVYLIFHAKQAHLATLAVGLGSLFLLIGFKRWSKKIPAAAIAFLIATCLLYFYRQHFGGESTHVALIRDVGELSALIPTFVMPSFDLQIINSLLSVAFAITLLSILETTSVAKAIASHTGQRLSINQEVLGLGLGNLTSAFLGAMPVSGSTSRTFLNFESGAQTRLAAIFGSLMLGAIVYMFESFVAHIPLASLSALLLVTAASIINKKQILLCLKATQADAFVFWVTFLSCVFFSIDIAFYIGVGLSIILYLKKAAMPQVLQYIVDNGGRLKSLEFCSDEEKITKIRFIKIKGELFFGAADLFQTTLKTIAVDDTNTRVIILQLKNARDIDATACLALQQLYDYLKNSGRHLLLSGVTMPIWEVMSDSDLVELIGKENIFLIDERNPNLYIQQVLKRALDLASSMEKKILSPLTQIETSVKIEAAPESAAG
ncbi:MAG TPA: SulP family inorganic anion transporter [Waddliaceae bacterium]